MKGWTITPDVPGGVSLCEIASPSPRANEAVVSVVAFSIDLRGAELLCRLPPSSVPGHDLAGIVVEPAADGSGPPRGARVVGLVQHGAWAERVAVPTSALALVPVDVTLVQAVALLATGGVERGEIAPHIGRVSPWDDLPDTLEALHDGTIDGKAVLCIPSGDILDT